MTDPLDIMKPLYEWTSVRWNKCQRLYELAQEATGPIVELGAYTGNGTIALGLGSRDGHGVKVYGIDQWQRFTGLYKQEFYPEDRLQCQENIKTMGLEDIIILVQGDLLKVAREVQFGPIALLVWDVSLPRLWSDFLAWKDLIAPGGLFVGKDTTVWDFGWANVERYGWPVVLEDKEACLWGVQRPE